MSFNNIIAIAGDKYSVINLITSKLVLLRDLDKVVDTNLENATEFLQKTMPNVIIVHSIGDSQDSLNTIKNIKSTEILKNIPILLYSEDCTKEFLIDAFDCGVSDIIKSPIEDWELLIRVIWCIQKNELNVNIGSKNDFLINLGIIQNKTGFYTENCVEQFLTTEINSAIKYKANACVMLVGPDDKFPPAKNEGIIDDVIKKSVRLNDSVGVRQDGRYYIYLPKTKLNGAYAVFERINNHLGLDLSVNASVAEVKDKDFVLIKQMLEKTYENTKNNSNTILVAHAILENGYTRKEDYEEGENDIVERRKNIKEKYAQQKPQEDEDKTQETLEVQSIGILPANEEILLNEEGANETPLAEILEGETEPYTPAPLNEAPKTTEHPVLPAVNFEDYTEDEARNATLFRQAYKKKTELVLKPVFEKFKLLMQSKHYMMDVINSIEFNQSYFELKQDDKILRLTINYPGFSKVTIITEIYLGQERRGFNAFDLGLTDFGFEKLSITLEGLINEYESYL